MHAHEPILEQSVALGPLEDFVRTYPTPNHVGLAGSLGETVLPGSPPIVCPCHLVHSREALNPFDAEASAEASPTLQVFHKLLARFAEGILLHSGEGSIVAHESADS